MTLQDLRRIVEKTKDESEELEVVIPAEFYRSPHGPSRILYSACAMGGCSYTEADDPKVINSLGWHRVLLLDIHGRSYD